MNLRTGTKISEQPFMMKLGIPSNNNNNNNIGTV
jgi:hypothetical protein